MYVRMYVLMCICLYVRMYVCIYTGLDLRTKSDLQFL